MCVFFIIIIFSTRNVILPLYDEKCQKWSRYHKSMIPVFKVFTRSGKEERELESNMCLAFKIVEVSPCIQEK